MAHSSYREFFCKDFKKAKRLFNIVKWTSNNDYSNNVLREKLLTKRIGKFIIFEYSMNEEAQLELLKNIKDVDMLVNWNTYYFGTILAFAIRNVKFTLIKELINRGAYLNVEELKGFKPFHNLGRNPILFSVDYLIDQLDNACITKSENIDRSNKNGNIHETEFAQFIIDCDDSIKILIENGIYLNITECKKLKVYNPQYLNTYFIFITKLKSIIESQTIKDIGEIIFNYLISKKVIKYLNQKMIDIF